MFVGVISVHRGDGGPVDDHDLVSKMEASLHMPPTMETVQLRAMLAQVTIFFCFFGDNFLHIFVPMFFISVLLKRRDPSLKAGNIFDK